MEEKGSNKKGQCDDLESSNLAFLHGELDPLVRKTFLQFFEAHEFTEVISCLKSQLLNIVLSRHEVSARQDAMTYLVRVRVLLSGW